MDKEIKEMYYLARYNMDKYILCDNKYYRIVGFRYLRANRKGFIVVGNSIFDFKDIEHRAISRIFLSQKDKLKYHYYFVSFPLEAGFTFVNDNDIKEV